MLTLHWSFPFKCHNLALILCFLRPEKTCMLSGHLAVGAPSLLSCLYQGFWGLSGPRSPHISPGGAPTVTSVKQPQSRESGMDSPCTSGNSVSLALWASLRPSLSRGRNNNGVSVLVGLCRLQSFASSCPTLRQGSEAGAPGLATPWLSFG